MSEVHFTPAVDVDAIGRLSFTGLAGRGARITSQSRCSRCGRPFSAGDHLLVHLVEDHWETAPVEHDGECPTQQ